MTENHKFSCETCDHYSTKEYEAGLGFCLKSKSGFMMESRKNISLLDFVHEVGCASHSAATHQSDLDDMDWEIAK